MADDLIALKPCPFCGCEVVRDFKLFGTNQHRVDCNRCNGGFSMPDRDSAVAFWNTRPAATALAARDEEIRLLREALEPFARYADGVGQFTGPSSPMFMSFQSSRVGAREITEADFVKARAALTPPTA